MRFNERLIRVLRERSSCDLRVVFSHEEIEHAATNEKEEEGLGGMGDKITPIQGESNAK